MVVNLFEETLEYLNSKGKSPSDVKWVGSHDGTHVITWETFADISNFDYDNGHGGAEIPTDLVVVGKGWWLERYEYDGAEWWVIKVPPPVERKRSHLAERG